MNWRYVRSYQVGLSQHFWGLKPITCPKRVHLLVSICLPFLLPVLSNHLISYLLSKKRIKKKERTINILYLSVSSKVLHMTYQIAKEALLLRLLYKASDAMIMVHLLLLEGFMEDGKTVSLYEVIRKAIHNLPGIQVQQGLLVHTCIHTIVSSIFYSI